MNIIQDAIAAVSIGGLYALYALGIAIIFGVAGVFNFAHGQLVAVAAYVLFALNGVPAPIALAGAVAAAVVLAVAMERGVFRFARNADPGSLLVMAFAVGTGIQSVVLLVAGAQAKSLSIGADLVEPVDVGGLTVVKIDLVTLAVVAVLLVGLALLLSRTRIGVQLRAAAEDFTMARLVGVNSDRVLMVAFAISGVLAGVAAILLTVRSGTLTPDMGLEPVLVAFVAVVIGGLGSLSGSAAGAFLLGALTVALQVLLPPDIRPYRDAILYALVIGILTFRPQGLISTNYGARV